ncbi:MAG: hypothetical protein IPO63_17425 [Bacteroidetes bacterium]|nr:hypothetical protein [Bacteroidota bacterium]
METARLLSLFYKKLLTPFIWFLFFLLSFRVLARFPSGIFEAFFILVVILTSIISIRDIILQWLAGKANYFHMILAPLFILPFITAYQANVEFHQPYLIGLLAQRQHFIIFAGYFLVLGLKNKSFDIDSFRKHFIRSLFIIMGIMLFFSVLINPLVFNNTDFVEFSLNKGWHYEFPSDVIATVILYSMFKLLKENKKRFILPLLFGGLYFLVYIQDRSQLLMIAITVFIFFIRNIDIYRKFIYILWGITGASALLLIIYIVDPGLIDHYITIFGNASTIVTGNTTTEYSTAMRISEAAIAIKGIAIHPLFGNGFISSQFKGGFSGFFGYFFASDVGILGNLFVYGIIGTLIFYIPFFVTLSWTKQLRKNTDILLTTCQYGMVFIFLDMITAASNIKYMGLPSIFFGIIYYYRYFVVNENNEKAQTYQIKSK